MKSRKDKVKCIGKITLALLVPVVIFYLLEWYVHNPWKDIRFDLQLWNIFFFEMLMIILYALIGRLHIALVIETVVFMIYGLANYFVLAFRAQPIMPWDFLSLGTAATVAGDFTYTLNKQAILVLACFGLLFILILAFCRNNIKRTIETYYDGPLKSWAFRLPAIAVALTLVWGYLSLLHDEEFVTKKLVMYDKLFTPTVMLQRDGTAVAFLFELQYIAVEKPQGYDREEAEDVLAEYATFDVNGGILEGNLTVSEEAPNMIVIMDEAFSDPAVLGEFETNEAYMPFVHSVLEGMENTISGTLHVSVKGGNTANTEFEFLTGNTMAFLPEGSIPYQQYIDGELPTMASWLKQLGYTTQAVHPYNASGWDRDTVYPLLGFEKADFNTSFPGASRVRGYISDAAAFDFVVEKYLEKEEGKPFFCFEVTMQNHSGYTTLYDNFTPNIKVDGVDSLALEQYLSLMQVTDSALEDMIDFFATQKEPTIVVFFGDHQPTDSVVAPIWNLQGKNAGTLTEEENALRYEVPFFIWANYDIDEETGVEISTNYLGGLVFETAGLPMPAYQNYLTALRKKIPVLTSRYMITETGYTGSFENFETHSEEVAPDVVETGEETLLQYKRLQYYMLFDGEE